jgi:DNA-binding CsgD family transcriptional regulator
LNAAADGGTAVTARAREAVPRDVQALLIRLVEKIVTASYKQRSPSNDFASGGQILLDVEVGDVRLLALRQEHPGPMSLLSPREQEIARMVASGYPNKTIASVLEISSWTVASHLRRIFIKLQVSSRTAMVTRLSGSALPSSPADTTRPAEMSVARTCYFSV